eukprot:428607-Pyramimonas_sp.AAC.1
MTNQSLDSVSSSCSRSFSNMREWSIKVGTLHVRGHNVRTHSTLESQRIMRDGSLCVGLRIRRLKSLQDKVAKQRDPRQVIAAMVGQPQRAASNLEVSSEGNALPTANAWTRQFWGDVQALFQQEEGGELESELEG